MRALVLAPFTAEALSALRALMPLAYEPWTETQKLHDPEELAARINAENITVLIVEADFMVEELFQAAQPLRFAAMCRAALNQVDLEAATRHGVIVVHTPGRNAQGVAELTLGLMLALARRIPQAHAYVHQGQWQDPVEPYINMGGVELAGKGLGIVGLGATGRRVARMGRAVGMRVVAYDPYAGPLGARRAGAVLTSVEDLLRTSDFVTLHAPETPETEGLLDAPRFTQMRAGSYLVNVSSPALVNQKALLAALAEGPLAGAAFDVHEAHPIPPNSPLLGLDNVVLTPHIGGATDGTRHRQSWMVLEDLQRFLAGRRPRHLANAAAWRRHGR